MSFQQFKQELSTWLTSLGAGQVSKEFFELIKNIGEARSKQEESAIILKESQQLKQALAQPIDNKKKLREVLIRMVYCEMLGVPVPYAYVTALSATQEAKTSEKKVAYICASLCLRGVGEWSVLATNSLRRDLENSSILDQWAALGALSALVTRETAPALVEPTCALLQHSRALIRKWTVHAIGHFIALHEHVIDEDSTGVEEELEAGHGLWSKLLAALYDKDPAVMMAVVSVLQPLIAKYGARFNAKTRRELLSALSAIQKQVLDHHLKDYDYHRVAAPWLQISLLKIFGVLGQLDASAARDLYHVLHETLNKSIAYLTQNSDSASHNAAYAVLHETVNTIVRVYKHAANDRNTEALVDEAATHVSHMLTFDPKSGAAANTRRTATHDPNLKYLALHSLSDLIEINPRHVIQHQVLLFKCLNDPDDSIQRQTLELLYKMTGPKNITLVVTKMLAHLKSSTDLYLRRDLIGKITALCEKFAPSPAWYIAAMLKCLYLGAELVQPSHLDQLLTVLQTGTGDLQQDLTLRRHAVKHAMKYLIAKNGNNKPQEQSVPDLLAQVIAWILGEYGNLLRDLEQYRHVTASDMLTDLLDRQYSRGEVRAWILMALAKRVARDWHASPVSSTTLETVLKYTASRHVVTQQIARDLTNLVTILNNLPRDHVIVSKLATLFDRPVKVDRKLTFLDEYTRQALRQGARDYQRVESSRDTAKSGVQTGREQSLRFETYKAPTVLGNATKSSGSIFEQTAEESKSIFNVPSATTPAAVPSGPLSAASLKQVSGPWSISGYGGAAPKPVAPVTPVAPSNSAPRDPTPSTTAPARSSPSVRSRDPVAPVPHQPSQEELMAALLFEGATKKTKAKKKRTPTSTNEHVSDSSSPLHTNEHVTQSSPLNTLNQGSPLNTINQGSPLNTVNQGSVDSLLSFDFNQPVLAANNSTSSVSIFDAFAPSTPDTKELQTLITPIAVSPNLARQLDPTFEDNFDLPNLTTTPFIQTEIDGRPRSHEKPQKIANDTQIQINYFHIWQEQSLGVVLFVCNKSDVVLSDLHLTVVPPDNFAVSYRGDSVVDLTRVNDHVLTINVIPPHTAVLVLIDLTLSQLIFNPTLSATLTYKTSSHAADKTIKCTAPIDLPDLLRTHTMTTESFGQQWGTHTCETKLVFKNKALSLEQFGQLIHAMNFTQIKVIGKEVIGASRLINTTPTNVLLHAKLESQQCEVKIRAKDRALSEVVARYFTRILKQ